MKYNHNEPLFSSVMAQDCILNKSSCFLTYNLFQSTCFTCLSTEENTIAWQYSSNYKFIRQNMTKMNLCSVQWWPGTAFWTKAHAFLVFLTYNLFQSTCFTCLSTEENTIAWQYSSNYRPEVLFHSSMVTETCQSRDCFS